MRRSQLYSCRPFARVWRTSFKGRNQLALRHSSYTRLWATREFGPDDAAEIATDVENYVCSRHHRIKTGQRPRALIETLQAYRFPDTK